MTTVESSITQDLIILFITFNFANVHGDFSFLKHIFIIIYQIKIFTRNVLYLKKVIVSAVPEI